MGSLYAIHPHVRERFSLRHRAAVATLDLETLLALPKRDTLARPVPQFPAITYDVTLPLSQREQAGDLLRTLRGADPLLESVEVTNLYAGKAQEKGDYALTLRFTYRAPDRTLSEGEAKPLHEKILRTASVTPA